MGAWLKLLGKADWKMPDPWTHERKELLRCVRFGGDTPPTEIAAGDRLVYYAIGWECFFAVVEVISDEPYEPAVTHEWEAQWPWAFDIKVIKKKLRLSESPSILTLGSTPDRRHQGHVALTTAQLEKAERALE
jgi:hypothetical protein